MAIKMTYKPFSSPEPGRWWNASHSIAFDGFRLRKLAFSLTEKYFKGFYDRASQRAVK